MNTYFWLTDDIPLTGKASNRKDKRKVNKKKQQKHEKQGNRVTG